MDVMSLTEIMDKSIDIVRKYIKTIILYNIGIGIIEFIIAFIMIIIATIFFVASNIAASNYAATGVLIFIIVIGVVDLYFWNKVGIIKITGQEYLEESVYANTAVGVAVKSIFKVLGITLIEILVFLPVAGIFGVIGYSIYSALDNPSSISDINSSNNLGLIIFSIVLIIAAAFTIIAYLTVYVFSLQSMVFENKGIIGSIKRSFSLVKKNYLRIYGCVIMITVTVLAIQYALDSFMVLVSGLGFMVVKFLNIKINYTTFITKVVLYLRWLLGIFSWLVISPISTIMMTLLYFNQRFKAEGYDILLRLKKLQKSDEGEQTSETISTNDAY